MKIKKIVLREYKKCWKFLRESSKYIWIITGIFFLFALIGFLIPTPEYLSQQIMEYVAQLLEKTKDFNFLEMFKFIFFNNFKSSFIGLFVGVFFGVFSLLVSLGNGYVLGFASAYASAQNGIGVLWRLAPHGIFELPAIFISLGMGLKLGSFFLKENKLEFVKENMKNSLRVFLLIVVPLLFIAAIIESLLIVLR